MLAIIEKKSESSIENLNLMYSHFDSPHIGG